MFITTLPYVSDEKIKFLCECEWVSNLWYGIRTTKFGSKPDRFFQFLYYKKAYPPVRPCSLPCMFPLPVKKHPYRTMGGVDEPKWDVYGLSYAIGLREGVRFHAPREPELRIRIRICFSDVVDPDQISIYCLTTKFLSLLLKNIPKRYTITKN